MSTLRASNRAAPFVWPPIPALRQHPLIGFFLLAYGFSWLVVIILGIVLHLPAGFVIALNTLGPTFAAMTLITLLEGRQGLHRLRVRLTLWRVGPPWYLVALLGIPLSYLLATLVLPSALAAFQPMSPLRWLITYVINFLAISIIGGPLFEELGWRGFALSRLQAQLGPLRGTLVLGGLWGMWHMPQYFVPEWSSQNGGLHPASIVIFLLTVLAIATIMTWVFNHTQGSLLLAILAHGSVNTAQVALVNPLFPSLANTEVNALLGFGIVALLLILVTRGRLGYQDSAA